MCQFFESKDDIFKDNLSVAPLIEVETGFTVCITFKFCVPKSNLLRDALSSRTSLSYTCGSSSLGLLGLACLFRW